MSFIDGNYLFNEDITWLRCDMRNAIFIKQLKISFPCVPKQQLNSFPLWKYAFAYSNLFWWIQCLSFLGPKGLTSMHISV